MASPDLLGLPEELKLWIVEYLTPTSPALLHLRASCSTMHGATQKAVAKRYFSDRAFLMADETSLQVLLEISKHSVFAKSMKRVRFSFAAIPPFLVGCHQQRQYDFQPEAAAMTQREQRILRRQFRRVHERLLEDERLFVAAGRNGDYLRAILTNFKNAGNTPALVATAEDFKLDSFHTEAWGYARLRRALAFDRCLLVNRTDPDFFFDLSDAMSDTNYPIAELEFGCERFGVPPSMFAFIVDNPYRNLKTLRLSLGHMHGVQCGVDLSEEATEHQARVLLKHFTLFLVDASNLEDLALSCEDDDSSSGSDNLVAFRSLVLAVTNPPGGAIRGLTKLRVLELERLWLDGGLFLLVEATRNTLRVLKMRRVRFFGIPRHIPIESIDMEKAIRKVCGVENLELDVKDCLRR